MAKNEDMVAAYIKKQSLMKAVDGIIRWANISIYTYDKEINEAFVLKTIAENYDVYDGKSMKSMLKSVNNTLYETYLTLLNPKDTKDSRLESKKKLFNTIIRHAEKATTLRTWLIKETNSGKISQIESIKESLMKYNIYFNRQSAKFQTMLSNARSLKSFMERIKEVVSKVEKTGKPEEIDYKSISDNIDKLNKEKETLEKKHRELSIRITKEEPGTPAYHKLLEADIEIQDSIDTVNEKIDALEDRYKIALEVHNRLHAVMLKYAIEIAIKSVMGKEHIAYDIRLSTDKKGNVVYVRRDEVQGEKLISAYISKSDLVTIKTKKIRLSGGRTK